MDKLYLDEVEQIFNHLKEIIPEDMEIIALPNDCKFYEDFPLDALIHLRNQLNEIIEREEAKQNDL